MIELHLGDCLEVMKSMPDKSVDAVITDPPYGIAVEIVGNNKDRWSAPPTVKTKTMEWDRERAGWSIPEIIRVSSNQVIFGGNYYADLLPPSRSWVVWDKLSSGVFADCELAWTSHNKAVRKFEYLWNGFRKQKPETRYHPTQKPLDLMVWVLDNYTKPGDTILDPFMGSGTTMVACVNTGRNGIGIEIDPQYFAIAEKRIKEARGQPTLLDAPNYWNNSKESKNGNE